MLKLARSSLGPVKTSGGMVQLIHVQTLVSKNKMVIYSETEKSMKHSLTFAESQTSNHHLHRAPYSRAGGVRQKVRGRHAHPLLDDPYPTYVRS